MIDFRSLKPGDEVYVVYDKKHDIDNESDNVIVKSEVIENSLSKYVSMPMDITDSDTPVVDVYNMKINVKELDKVYDRRYRDSEKPIDHLRIAPNNYYKYPVLEVFTSYEDAKSYLQTFVINLINSIKQTIDKYENHINQLQKSLNQLNNDL